MKRNTASSFWHGRMSLCRWPSSLCIKEITSSERLKSVGSYQKIDHKKQLNVIHLQLLEARRLVVLSPVLAKEGTSNVGHGIQTALVHLRRFAPNLTEGQIFTVSLLLPSVSNFPSSQRLLYDPESCLLYSWLLKATGFNLETIWRGLHDFFSLFMMELLCAITSNFSTAHCGLVLPHRASQSILKVPSNFLFSFAILSLQYDKGPSTLLKLELVLEEYCIALHCPLSFFVLQETGTGPGKFTISDDQSRQMMRICMQLDKADDKMLVEAELKQVLGFRYCFTSSTSIAKIKTMEWNDCICNCDSSTEVLSQSLAVDRQLANANGCRQAEIDLSLTAFSSEFLPR